MTRTTRRQSKSSSLPPPIKHARNAPYFSQKCFREWTLGDYLDDTGIASADKLPDALRCWTQSLRTIAKCRDKACCPLRNVTHARLLLSAYKQDKIAVKERFDVKRGSKSRSSTSTVDTPGTTPSVEVGDEGAQLGTRPSESDAEVLKPVEDPETHAKLQSRRPQLAPESSAGSARSPRSPPQGHSDDESRDSDSSDSSSQPSHAYIASSSTWSQMKPGSKWLLSSGMVVEDIVHDACRVSSGDAGLLPLFIVDLSAPSTAVHFTKVEILQLTRAFPEMPLPNKMLSSILKPYFAVRSIEQLEAIRPTLPDSSDDDIQEDPAPLCRWVNVAITNCCHLLLSANSLVQIPQAEGWYNYNVWHHIIDAAFIPVPSIMLARGESICRASSLNLNSTRTSTGPDNRQRLGPKLDGIIRSTAHDYLEFGAIEAAKDFKGTGATKWIEDGAKLRGVLRDMLVRLHNLVDDDSVKKLQTVGIICAGLKMQLVRCWGRKRGGAVFTVSEARVEQYPKTMHEVHKHLWLLMRAVDSARRIVVETVRVVERAGSPMTEEKFHHS